MSLLLRWLTPIEPPCPPVPEDMVRICVSGFHFSPNVGRAVKLAEAIAAAHSQKYDTWFYMTTVAHYSFLRKKLAEGGWLPDRPAEQWTEGGSNRNGVQAHTKAPFVWLEFPDGTKRYIGGREYCACADRPSRRERDLSVPPSC